MFRRLLPLSILVLTVACGSSQNSTAPLELRLAQTSGTNDMYYFRGMVPVQFALQISNPTNQTYTLRRLNLQSTGPGAYSIHTGDSPFNYTIPANGTVTIPLSAWARSSGGFMRATEPVDLRAIAYFDGPSGSFVKQFTTILPQ